ncbi:MAG TPA: hypothetical protein VM118_01565 [Acidobacteriota bacterium]|nr:hypothetical protein [Acidobacteriota bacterium]
MSRQRMWKLSACCVAIAVLCGSGPAWTRDAASEHWAAWDAALGAGDQLPVSPFAFYAYRTMAVPHPEVYLLSDQLFSQIVENLPGGRAFYTHPDPMDVRFFLRVQNGELNGPGFSWRDWLVTPDSVRDQEPTDWNTETIFDQRLPSAAVLLRTASPSLSTIEGALLRYAQRRRLGRDPEGLFVVVSDDGAGYLVDDTLFLKGGLHRWSGVPEAISPVLVFNEKSVYYPLFGRDDRGEDPTLGLLLNRLGPPAVLDLSTGALQRINRLRTAAALHDDKAVRCAATCALGLRDVDNPLVRDQWSAFWSLDDATEIDCMSMFTASVYFQANHLSPLAAVLSTHLDDRDLKTSLPELSTAYLAHCGRSPAFDTTGTAREAFGVLWSYGLLDLTLDDVARTRTGGSSSQAAAMSAILDLAGVPHVGIISPSGRMEGQDLESLLAGDGWYEFTLGSWRKVTGVIQRTESRAVVLWGYRVGARAGFFYRDYVCANTDALQVIDDLAEVERMLPYAAIAIRYGEKMTRFGVLINDLGVGTARVVAPSCGGLVSD